MEKLKFLEKVKALLILSAWGASVLFIIGAPRQIINVYSVNNSQPEQIKIEKIYLTSESCGVRNICDHIAIEATNQSTNLPIEERIEIEPGVFPFGISSLRKQVWSTKRKHLNEYNEGEVYSAYFASNGRYYLSKGSYFPFAYLLVFSVIWLGGNAVVIARHS